jgi:hypothetical protein
VEIKMKKINEEKLDTINGGGFWNALFWAAAIVDAVVDTASGIGDGWNSYTPGPRRAGHH